MDSSGLLNRTRCAAMQVFLYEFICGGGLFAEDEPPAGSLYREGWAMLSALAEDFAALPGVELTILWDERIGASPPASCRVVRIRSAADEEEQLERLAAASDCTLLIAPESGGALLSRASRAAATESQLVSPAPEFIELASDKQRTAEMLRSRGVPAPPGVLLNQARRLPSEFPLPAVLKPNDGAGSQAIRWIEDESQLGCIIGGENLETAREHGRSLVESSFRLETFHPGAAVSIAALCGPRGFTLLPPCRQRLSSDGRFAYRGGELFLPPPLASRARKLAARTLEVLPPALGYVGLDLVLGAASDGSEDVVIEVNPRLTTSYVGLRRAAEQNLAGAMLDVARGREPQLSFDRQPLQFEADGSVYPSPWIDP